MYQHRTRNSRRLRLTKTQRHEPCRHHCDAPHAQHLSSSPNPAQQRRRRHAPPRNGERTTNHWAKRSNNSSQSCPISREPATTADITIAKRLFNSVLSTPDTNVMTIDIKDFYLNTPMEQYE
jgi:hypothetical protein